jgi:transcriptional regulator with XRE-family HTH domain
MTQDDAVRATGLSRSTISKIENAEQSILEKNVRLLAGAYGVTSPELDMLLGWRGRATIAACSWRTPTSPPISRGTTLGLTSWR